MSTKDRRKLEKEKRKQSILGSAKKLFVEKGINKTTMNDIAEDVELAIGTIYLYFKNKDEIILSLYLLKLQHFNEFLALHINEGDTCINKILLFHRLTYLFYRENPIYLIVTSYWDYHNFRDTIDPKNIILKKLVKLDTEILQYFVDIFKEGINRKEIKHVEEPLKYLLVTDISLAGLIKMSISKADKILDKYNYSTDSLINTFLDIIRNDLLAE